MLNLRSFFRDRNEGSVSIAVGVVFILISGAVAAALDYSSAHNRRSDLQRASDAAALAGAARADMEIKSIEELALSNLKDVPIKGVPDVDVERDADGKVTVEITAISPTAMMGIVGYDGVEVYAESAAVFVPANGKLEVALVLDTTQSMEDDMAELRSSAGELATTLFEFGGENAKVSVVPYVASVNIGNGATQMAWMDTAGGSTHHALEMRNQAITRCNPTPTTSSSSSGGTTTTPTTPSCTAVCGCPGTPACGGGNDGASLEFGNPLKYAGGILGGILGADVADAGPLPYPTPDPASCPIANPATVNYLDIYDAMPNAEWGGCVEARPSPYDVTDAGPDADGDLTRFVPYFWSDEADWLGDDTNIDWANDYLDDEAAGPAFDSTSQYFPTWSLRRRANVYKYNDVAAADLEIVETGADRKGPNRACPDPMLALTNDEAAVASRISNLTHRNGGGTVISEGVMWGWRALSPGAPFSEGVDYDEETRKIVILMSDGANSVIARNDSSGMPYDETMGDYTAYGFAREFDENWPSRGIIDTSTNTTTAYFDQIREALDEKTLQACSNIKAAGLEDNRVEIYTVLVGDSDTDTANLMASCATTRDNHYKGVSSAAALREAFTEIVESITSEGSSRLVN